MVLRTSVLLLLVSAAPAWPAVPTTLERLVHRAEPSLVGVWATIEVRTSWQEPGAAPRSYGPWEITSRGEGVLVGSSGVVATAAGVVDLAAPERLAELIEERFLLEVAEAWRRDAEARGQQVAEDSLREGLRRLRRRGSLVLESGAAPMLRVGVDWGSKAFAVRGIERTGESGRVALLTLDGAGPFPRLAVRPGSLEAGTRVRLLRRRPGAPPEVLDGQLSRHPEVADAWATDLAVTAGMSGAPVVDADGRFVGVAIESLGRDSPFGVSWVAAAGPINDGADPLGPLWEQALDASWGGDVRGARSHLERILAIQSGFEVARRRLESLPPPDEGWPPRPLLVAVAAVVVLLGVIAVILGAILRKRAGREMIR